MKAPRNTITVVLMISSILLLIGLQAVWLTNVYEKEFFDFRKETSTLLKDAVMAQWDVAVESYGPAEADSTEHPSRVISMRDSPTPVDDTLNAERTLIISHSQRLDTTSRKLNRMVSIPKLDREQKFVIRVGPDTLSMDTLSMYYKNSLQKAGIESHFKIEPVVAAEPDFVRIMNEFTQPPGKTGTHHRPDTIINGIQKSGSPKVKDVVPTPGMRAHLLKQITPHDFNRPEDTTSINAFSDTVITDIAKFGSPRHGYVASFPGMHTYLLKQIAPQISFAFLLTAIVSTSFLVIYQSLRKQQKLNVQKNDFISNVTHELKTPLATVSVALEALKNFHALDDPQRTKEYLDIAQNELQRLTFMTDKILKASVFETQGVSFIPEKVNLNIIIEKILSSLKLVFEKNETRVAYTPVGNNFNLSGSEIHLTNVIYNLLDNALKYGSKQTTIDLQLKDNDGFLEFTIRDQGLGIAKEYQKKIFEKFFRVPTGDVHNVKGYGLGLNYVARVVEKHGGHIDVESEPGKGSLFKIKLPK